ncbi:carboxylesterase/lipase family protein [Deinococcus sp.]|uniref:carboxylesterase/lipase family protein n=1 Tax=Deinococcus sp. TaxID=47478 RepID=UPI003CC5C229
MTSGLSTDPLLRETASGSVRGRRMGDSLAWLGLPYAQAASGPLRFRSPQPHPGWAGVREATQFGPDVLQPLDPSVTLRPSAEGSLVLNIWAPAGGGPDLPETGLPVLLWLHGGAFRAGSGRLYDGSRLAAAGNVVVVTVNSRLGPLGYANFGGLYSDERFAHNAGFQDQVAALRWVNANIAAFGGDPGRVTVAGQSAGAVAVGLLLLHPDARPLLSGAIMQSGALNQVSTWESSLENAHAYADALGIRRENLNALWTLPPGAFVAALHTLERTRPRRLNSRPYLDGGWLPGSVRDLLTAPSAPVPLLIGANREESSVFVKLPERVFPRTDRTSLANLLDRWAAPQDVLRILSAYPDTQAGLIGLGTDMNFQVPADHFALRHGRGAAVWRYRFDWGTRVLGLGAAHGTELLFLWPRPLGSASELFRGPVTSDRTALAQRMQQAWLRFVRDGYPGAAWPAATPERPIEAVFGLGEPPPDEDAPARRQHLWRGLHPLMP